jgi:FMN-dependent NADH-azoreductase
MATLLHLDSSADLTGSVSRRLTARFAAGWATLGHATVRRDLFLDQPPHLPSSVLHWAPSLRATDERWIQRTTATRRSWSASYWQPTLS